MPDDLFDKYARKIAMMIFLVASEGFEPGKNISLNCFLIYYNIIIFSMAQLKTGGTLKYRLPIHSSDKSSCNLGFESGLLKCIKDLLLMLCTECFYRDAKLNL